MLKSGLTALLFTVASSAALAQATAPGGAAPASPTPAMPSPASTAKSRAECETGCKTRKYIPQEVILFKRCLQDCIRAFPK